MTAGGVAAAADAATGPSTNRNTMKNKRRRAKEKEERLARAQQRRDGSSSSSSSAAVAVDATVKSSIQPVQPGTATGAVSEREHQLQLQQLSEANNAKRAAIAAALSAEGKWFTHPQCQSSAAASSAHTVVLDQQTQSRLQALREKAQSLLSAYSAAVSADSGAMSRDDARWLSSIMQGGTLSDKVAGMQLLMQDRCVGRLDVLERLLQMAGKKGRRESGMAVDALRELLLSELMPTDRPLLLFSHHRELHSQNTAAAVPDSTLLYWLYEDALKRAYSVYLSVLEQQLHDAMPYVKKQALNTLFALLAAIPEREKTVLALIVNKLGDPDRKIASRVVYLLSELCVTHPALRLPVVRELELFLFRSGVSERGQYYAVIWLSQLRFGQRDAELAARLVQLYFQLFTAEVRKAEALTGKLLAAVLTGINRAMPFAKGDGAVVLREGQLDLLFSLAHTAAFSTAVQSLMLLWQVVCDDVLSALASRYYRCLYELMRAEAVGAGGKVSLFLNLLYRSMKADESLPRVAAFVKRLLQVAASRGAAFLCGCLYLVSEIMQRHGGLKALMEQRDSAADDDEDEHFVDVKDEPDDAAEERKQPEDDDKQQDAEQAEIAPGNMKKADGKLSNGHDASGVKGGKPRRSGRYDANKREPLYANAHNSALWELVSTAEQQTHSSGSAAALPPLLLTASAAAVSSCSGRPAASLSPVRAGLVPAAAVVVSHRVQGRPAAGLHSHRLPRPLRVQESQEAAGQDQASLGGRIAPAEGRRSGIELSSQRASEQPAVAGAARAGREGGRAVLLPLLQGEGEEGAGGRRRSEAQEGDRGQGGARGRRGGDGRLR